MASKAAEYEDVARAVLRDCMDELALTEVTGECKNEVYALGQHGHLRQLR